jgi:Fur family ferric uptake transcriptional regulator
MEYPGGTLNFPELLRGAGLKVTGTRLALLQLVGSRGRHMTADEITAGLSKAGAPADRVTVYRNIDKLLRSGLLIATHIPGRALRVGLCTRPGADHHHHIVCHVCGRISETTGCCVAGQWDQLKKRMSEQTGWTLTDHAMQYIGICPDCAATRPRAADA